MVMVGKFRISRAQLAREEFLARFCASWPAIYKALMPVTDNGSVLLESKEEIARMMKADFEAYAKAVAATKPSAQG